MAMADYAKTGSVISKAFLNSGATYECKIYVGLPYGGINIDK